MSAYTFFTSKELKPKGWIFRQLKIQANSLAGQLDKVWPDVRDSQWIGGNREGWERVPYWLDGFIPLAFLLDNKQMIKRAKKYIDKIIENQQPDGWICPNGNTPRAEYDTWAVILLSKVLTVWYDCSDDERIPEVLYKALKNYYDMLSSGEIKLFNWAKARWFETFIALNLISKLYPNEKWISELAKILKTQGLDYNACRELFKVSVFKWTFETHIVNIGMMLKYEAVSHKLLGEKYIGIADELYDILTEFNGTPVGIFTGDECLAGLSPVQGTELCHVVELMYSLEQLYAATGDSKWAEILEKVSFNALPGTFTDDMWGHQYDQMSNQINAVPFEYKPIFGTNGTEANVFGLEPNYGCCTANMGQGWPKLALSAFMKADDGIVSAVPLPSELTTDNIKIRLDTDYPFNNSFVYRAFCTTDTATKLYIRLPSFAENIKLNGKPIDKQDMITIDSFKAGETKIYLSYTVKPEIQSLRCNLNYVKCGSLIFSLPIDYNVKTVEYERDGVERKFPYCDYQLSEKSAWNYALVSKRFKVTRRHSGKIPFSSLDSPVKISAKVAEIDWRREPGYPTVCRREPYSTKPLGKPQEIKLIPYGCAKLRITELPVI